MSNETEYVGTEPGEWKEINSTPEELFGKCKESFDTDDDWICDHCGKRHIWWDDREKLDETDDIVEIIDLHIKWFEKQADQPEQFREWKFTKGYLAAYENMCEIMRPLVDALKQQDNEEVDE